MIKSHQVIVVNTFSLWCHLGNTDINTYTVRWSCFRWLCYCYLFKLKMNTKNMLKVAPLNFNVLCEYAVINHKETPFAQVKMSYLHIKCVAKLPVTVSKTPSFPRCILKSLVKFLWAIHNVIFCIVITLIHDLEPNLWRLGCCCSMRKMGGCVPSSWLLIQKDYAWPRFMQKKHFGFTNAMLIY